MKKLLVVVIIAAALLPGAARAAWNGKLDLTPDFSLAAYQSVTSPDEVFGVGKRLFSLNKESQDIVNIGIFGGVDREDSHGLAGFTGQVPGSLLDWALNTKMGAAWLPDLKTGMLFGYDLTRPKELRAEPNFIGLGIAWPFKAGS